MGRNLEVDETTYDMRFHRVRIAGELTRPDRSNC
jgi:hypothetical protein